jgi:hypothetical protein
VFWIKEYTDRIRSLLKDGDASSLSYAALEVRLALERICYERLRNAHSYISADDLRTWKPQYVVLTLMEMVDPKIASDWTLSMGSEPGDHPEKYIEIGTQRGFDPKRVNHLWQAMSSFLHAEFPRSSDHDIEHYKSPDKMRRKIEEALQELDRLATGTLIGSLVFEQVSFTCVCGQLNKRSTHTLSHCQIINCFSEGCKEQYVVEKGIDEFLFERRVLPVFCEKCAAKTGLPYRLATELPKDTRLHFSCRECGQENNFMWRLMQVTRAPGPVAQGSVDGSNEPA